MKNWLKDGIYKNKKEAKYCYRSINIFLKELLPGKLKIITAIL